ncbi:MAG: SufD family Fe-S cluster assembly protein [Candidatus Choladocola sp.]|nr:SufD family Fe-S cluster assembly protein [Candidatus Choladocola sp.]
MKGFDAIQANLLEAVAGFHEIPTGAFNIRSNGATAARNSTEHIEIVPKEDGTGIEIRVKPGTRKESVHMPVILSQTGMKEVVYNDFYIGDDADVTIIAGCGIHNGGDSASRHDGIHRFFVGKNAKIRYVEKHYGSGDGKGERIMNPRTIVEIDENGYMEMDTVQIKGVDSTVRKTEASLAAGAHLVVMERLMTHGTQNAESHFKVELNGDGSGANIVSRSVARDESRQLFVSNIEGNARCSGHSECDAIIVGDAKISAVPEITANDSDAALIHEAAIGKIAGEQIVKLMTLGLTEAEAEEQIISGFLK